MWWRSGSKDPVGALSIDPPSPASPLPLPVIHSPAPLTSRKRSFEEAGSPTTMLPEFWSHCLMYGGIILSAVLCIPSNLLLVLLFSPSRYELKLREVKKQLAQNSRDSKWLSDEFNDFRVRYHYCLSRPFYLSCIQPLMSA